MTAIHFPALLALTVLVRGLGAGIILGVGLLTNPVQRKTGFAAYLSFIKIYYKGPGVRFYALLTGAGLGLTWWLLVKGHSENISPLVLSYIRDALAATLLGFAGTAGAFPTMQKLWACEDKDLAGGRRLLRRFEFWQWVSTTFHVAAFCLLAWSIKIVAAL